MELSKGRHRSACLKELKHPVAEAKPWLEQRKQIETTSSNTMPTCEKRLLGCVHETAVLRLITTATPGTHRGRPTPPWRPSEVTR